MSLKNCILVVDDEDSQRKSLSFILQKKGYLVESAGTGKEALEKAGTRTINLTLLDIHLPDIDGLELVVPLQQINPDMTIIMVTGLATVENTLDSLNAGVSGYLIKPINIDEMLAKVRDSLERQALIKEKREAQRALRESEERYRTMTDSSLTGIYIFLDGIVKYVNPAFARMLGYTPQELIGTDPLTLIHPDDRAMVSKKMQDRLDHKEETSLYESRLVSKDNRIISVTIMGSLVPYEGGLAISGNLIDITERKRAEEALRKSEEKFHTVADFTYNWELWVGPNKQILYCSPSCERITGYPPDAFITEPELLEKIIHPDDLILMEEHNSTAREFHEPLSVDFRIICRDGSVRWISHTCQRVIAHDGTMLGRRVSNRDITVRKQAEEALNESEAKYRRFFSTSRDCIFITSKDGHLIDINDAAVESFGYSNIEELMQVPVSDLYVNEEDRINHISIVIERGFTKEFPVDMRKKDGSIIHTLITTVARYDGEGNVIGFQGTIRDITDRKRIEDIFRESEKKYRAFFITSKDSVFITTTEGRWEDFNDAAITLFGYESREDLLKTGISSLYANPLDRNTHIAYIRENGYSFEYPVDLKKKNGTIINTLISTVARTDASGNTIGFQGSIRDVTERKQAEDALRESEARLNSIVHGSPMLQFVIDKNHRVFSWNKAIEEYSGIKSADIVGTRDQWKAFYENERPVLADLLVDERVELLPEWYPGKFQKSHLVEGAYEATDFFPDMGVSGKWLYFTAAPIRNDKGTIIGSVETLEDITERKEMERALQLANEKLHLLSSITRHDILNSLTALLGYLEFSQELVHNDAVLAEYLQKEQSIAEGIRHQIEFTKFYQDIGVNAPGWQNVEDTIRMAVHQLHLTDITVNDFCAGFEIFADALIGKVFFNLIENSIRHGEQVTTITCSYLEDESGLMLIYTDDGIGVPMDEKGKIFRQGFGKHTGFGMFLTKEILSITGISIIENGEPGKGVRFEIRVAKGKYRIIENNQ